MNIQPLFFLLPARESGFVAAKTHWTAGRFRPITTAVASFGFSADVVWLAFSLQNPTAQTEWVIHVDYPLLDSVTLYDAAGTEIMHSGDTLPFSTRPVPDNAFAAKVSVPTNHENLYFLAIRSGSSLVAPISVMSARVFYDESDRTSLVNGLIVGAFLVMALYNFFIFFSTREAAYLHYVCYILALTGFLAGYSGILSRYLLHDSPWLANNIFPVFAGLGLVFSSTFAYLFLDVSRSFARWKYAMQMLVATNIFATLSTPWLGNRLTNRMTMIVSIILLGTAAISYYKKNRSARFFLFAWAGYGIIATIWSLSLAGAFYNKFVMQFGLSIGAAIEVVFLSFALADKITQLREEKESALLESVASKLKLVDSYSRFVPRQFLKALDKNSVEDVALGDAVQKDITLLFCDIRQFTRLSEKMGVQDNFRFLNAYLGRIGPVINKNRGFIDKFIGDAIMAIFTESSEDAFLAAVEMLDRVVIYNQHRANLGYDPIQVGIGLHKGTVMLGSIGSVSRMDTTVIGDSVNLAARIEELTKKFSTPLLLTDAVFKAIPEEKRTHIREIDSVRVRGKRQEVALFQYYGFDKERREALLAHQPLYERSLAFYRAGLFSEALESFSEYLSLCADDAIVRQYAEQCSGYAKHPPGANWTPVIDLS